MAAARVKFSKVLGAAALLLACAAAAARASCRSDFSPPCQAFWAADVVFVGTAVEVTHTEKYRTKFGDDEWDARDRVTRFEVEEVFRGEAGREAAVTATEVLPTPFKLPDGSEGSKSTSGGDCEYRFKPGERYVDYARHDEARPGRLRVALNRAGPLARSAEDLAFLRGLKTADPPTGRVYGRVVRRDRDPAGGNYAEPAPGERAPFPRTFYPGAARAAQATALELGPGQRLTLFDLRLPPRYAERTFEVAVAWPDGRPVGEAFLRLENDEYPWDPSATRQERLGGAGRYRVTGFEGVTYWVHAQVDMKGGGQMHAEPVRLVLGEGAGPLRLVIASPHGNCTHYLGGRNRKQ